jgi:hypothetical protein
MTFTLLTAMFAVFAYLIGAPLWFAPLGAVWLCAVTRMDATGSSGGGGGGGDSGGCGGDGGGC